MRSDKLSRVASALGALLTLNAGCGAPESAEAPATPNIGTKTSLLSALDRCNLRLTADASETAIHGGGQVGVSFPTGDNPPNFIFPGDIVRVTASGSVRYDLWGNSAGPGGTGAVATAGWPFPGLGQVSSVANWNNDPGGWVGSPMQTTALAGCTPAPAGYPVRLLYYINDGGLWDNGGSWTIRTEVFRPPGRVVVEGLELTQGIQTPEGQIPLIAGKRTFVRAYVRGTDDGRGPLAGVTATLRVDGQTRIYAPIGSSSITASLTGSDRRSLNDSFLFELDAAAIGAGSRRVTVTVNPPPGRGDGLPVSRSATATFGPGGVAANINLYAARYSYYNIPLGMQQQLGLTSTWWQARPVSAWEPMRLAAENAIPSARLTITELAPSAPWGSTYIDCRAVQAPNGSWGCGGYVDARTYANNTIDARCPGGGCWIAVLQPEIDQSHHGAHWMTPRGNHAINLQGEAQPTEQGLTLAHEIGHGLSLGHTWEDGAYPRVDGGMGPFVALRYSPTIALVSGQSAAGATTAYDLMSYSSPAWFSPYSYCKALAVASGNQITCPPSTRR